MERDKMYKAMGEVNPSLLEEFAQMEQEKPPKRVKKVILPAMALVPILLCASFILKGKLDSQQLFENNSEIPPSEKVALLTSDTILTDMKVSNELGTIHITEITSDEFSAYIFFDFIANDGIILDKKYYDFRMSGTMLDENMSGYSLNLEQLEKKSNNQVSFLFEITFYDSIVGIDLNLFFGGFYGTNNKQYLTYPWGVIKMEDVVADDGVIHIDLSEDIEPPAVPDDVDFFDYYWEVESFKLNFESNTTDFEVNAHIVNEKLDVVINTISISPMSINVKGHVNYHEEIPKNSTLTMENASAYAQMGDFIIHYSDGTEEKAETSGQYDSVTGEFSYTHQFVSDLDKNITGITYQGEFISIEE